MSGRKQIVFFSVIKVNSIYDIQIHLTSLFFSFRGTRQNSSKDFANLRNFFCNQNQLRNFLFCAKFNWPDSIVVRIVTQSGPIDNGFNSISVLANKWDSMFEWFSHAIVVVARGVLLNSISSILSAPIKDSHKLC